MCVSAQSSRRKMTLRQRTAAGTGHVAKPIRVARSFVMLTTLFQALQLGGFFGGDSVITCTADLALCSFSYDI